MKVFTTAVFTYALLKGKTRECVEYSNKVCHRQNRGGNFKILLGTALSFNKKEINLMTKYSNEKYLQMALVLEN